MRLRAVETDADVEWENFKRRGKALERAIHRTPAGWLFLTLQWAIAVLQRWELRVHHWICERVP